MDEGAAITAALLGLALTGHAFRAELLRADMWMLGKARKIRKALKPYLYTARHHGPVGRHHVRTGEEQYTYINEVRVILKNPVMA
jgi:hypothetical protein